MSIRPRLIAWAEPRHEPVLRAILADDACELLGICSAKASHATALASEFGTQRLSDLRQAILSPEAEVVWLATPVTLDQALKRAIREHGLLVLSSEPLPDLLAQAAGEGHDAELVTFVPAFVDGGGVAAAQDAFEQFGPCRALNVTFTSKPEHGSLFARLFDAMITVRTLLGEAEIVDAAMTISRANVPDQLAGMNGTMTLNLRVEGQRSASVLVSNEAAVWRREALAIGNDGQVIRISEDSASPLDEEEGAGKPASPGSLIAERLMRFMQLPGESRAHAGGAMLLAMCEAARLSAKVGTTEAPGAISHMLGRT